MVTKSILDVNRIDKDGITFKDETMLYFKECLNNFQKMYLGTNSTCIAQRDIDGIPPYFEFYTSNSHTKVVFVYKGILSKYKK